MTLGVCLFRSAAAALLLASSAFAQDDDLAPSCTSLTAEFAYSGELQGGDLLTVSAGNLIDVSEADFAPRSKDYRLYYVYQNAACEEEACVDTPVILIKTLKRTNADPGPFVYLMREGSNDKTSVEKERYDTFHNDALIIPREPFNSFHVLYRTPTGVSLKTNWPIERRQKYIFADIPAGHSSWLTARNYKFRRNEGNLLQCIPVDVKLQRGTESAYVEIVEVEDGTAGVPTNVTRWPLTIR